MMNSAVTHDAGNRLTQRGATNFTYDDNGNLTSDGVNTYVWNARNQLASINGAVSASFTYDAFGRRSSRNIGGQVTGYLYDGANVVQEQNAGSSPTANLLMGGIDETFSRNDVGSGNNYTPITDALGSTMALLNAAGVNTTNYLYEPFGGTAATGSANGNNSKFTGREDDGGTGLYHYRARYYSPSSQRFISEDPIGFAGGDANFYAYVANNPVSNTDPTGMYLESGVDIALILYDLYRLAVDGRKNLGINLFALGADVAMLFVPVGTGAGPGIRLYYAGNKHTAQASIKSYQTYTKTHPQTGEVYSGRTSGQGTPLENIANRDRNHHRNDDRFGPAELDKSSANPDAIRGREQDMLDFQRRQGTAADQINGISPKNPNRQRYRDASKNEFGDCP